MSVRTGVYLHWPYCARICPYCDFNVVKARDIDMHRWQRALTEDIRYWRDRLGARTLDSFYFGGGTPSLMEPELVRAVLDKTAALFAFNIDAEITLEANPTDAEIDRFADYGRAGVNRLSLGVQSFDDDQLKFLGRNHNGHAAARALNRALESFGLVTFDLIYGLPDESAHDWEERLVKACAMGAGHLSLYQLTIEQGTAFGLAVGRGDWSPPDEDMAADLYEITQSVTRVAGLPAYEISNHARPGQEAVHNSLYWQGADWIGIGPGAHGRLTLGGHRTAIIGEPNVEQYLSMTPAERYAEERLDDLAIATEALAGGLRQVAGIDLRALGDDIRDRIAPVCSRLSDEGFLTQDSTYLRISPKGRLLTDHIVSQLTTAL
ncbi:radical SAM family heme chaperone HemW [Parvularcula sp. LCG005]|uniref:radical SAM family heme chaperone HemW n=1 Tax=Parvularcula sp. LCG005 TaxID=3078805 RepID=UPI00294234AA|nr:radical SAM family heme chaperone HemW [Parvularcula sp. LCG005]WOI53518.1 radical SAM family heme chaperone HemW [Parvularcula sp. LCG005]